MDIPRMHMKGFDLTLQKYARGVGTRQAVVEVGSWMGASAAHVLKELSGLNELHLFDQWRANQSEVDKLASAGLAVDIGTDLLPFCRENLLRVGSDAPVHYYKGDIRQARYEGMYDIGLYIDDASKNQAPDIIPAFAARMVPGCIALMCDFFYGPCDQQRAYLERLPNWRYLGRDRYDTNVAIWRVE